MKSIGRSLTLIVALLAAVACTPSAPASPTAAPAKPTEAPKAAPAAAPAAPAAASPAAAAASPAAAPAASPAAAAAEKPAVAASPAAAAAPADKASGSDYYAGKTITIIAGSSPGGGTDNVNRTVARHIARFIPGKPNVIVQNVDGAGGIIALNQVATAKPDGLTWNGSISQTQLYAQIQGASQVRYDVKTLTWVGTGFEDSQALWLRSETPFTSLDAIKNAATPPKLGAQAGTHPSVVLPKIITEVTGMKFNIVTGYPGSPEILLDIERGALDGRFSSGNSLKGERPEWIEKKLVRFFMVTSRERQKDMPDIPTISEIVPAEKKALLTLVFGPQDVNRSMAGPPGIPPEIAKPMIDAYAQMAKDPEFISDVTRTGFDPGFTSPTTLKEGIVKLMEDQEAKTALIKILGN